MPGSIETLKMRVRDLLETLRPIKVGYARRYPVNPEATLVTAFVSLPDGAFGDGRTARRYREWMRSILSIRQYMTVFIEDENADFVRETRKNFGDMTEIITVSKDELSQSANYRNIQRIIAGRYMEKARRNDRIELREPLYNTIMFSKPEFVARAIRSNRFKSRFFFWIDAGLGHGMNRRLLYRGLMNRPWPNPEKNHLLNKTMMVLATRSVTERRDIASIFLMHDAMLAGGLWGGDGETVLKFCEAFRRELDWSFEHDLLDDDQAIMTAVYLKHPQWFTLVPGRPFLDNRCYILKCLDGA